MNRGLVRIVLVTGVTLCMAACAPVLQRVAPRTATIGHIVFVDLKDEGDRAELIADSDAMLATIPSVASYAAGEHLDTGREMVLCDYSVGIYLGFETEQDLADYVAHPQHIEYVTKWKPRLESLRVHDVYDPTP